MPAFTLLQGGGGSTTVVNNLTSGGTAAALSAEQGKLIGNQIRPGGNVATVPEFTSRQALVAAITAAPQVGLDLGTNFTRIKVKAYYTAGPYVDIDYVVTNSDPTANDAAAVALGGSKWLTIVPANGYVTPSMFGANGSSDEGSFVSAMINYCHATGTPGFIDKPYNIGSARSISSKTVSLFGSGAGAFVVSNTNTLSFVSCNGTTITNVGIRGNLSSETQYSTFKTGVADAFASMTYDDGTSTVAGSDFTHTLSGNLLTVSLGSTLAGDQGQRNCVSTAITLGVSKTFCISLLKGWVTGDGANATTFQLLDASQVVIGTFEPQIDTNPFTSNIKNAAFLRIKVGARRGFRTASGLTCVYDLSKIVIHECVNEMAGIAANDGSPSTNGMVHVVTSDSFVWDGGLITNSKISGIKLISCTNCTIKNTKVRFVFQGLSSQTGTGNAFLNNDIDVRFRTTGSALIGNKAIRNRCIGAYDEKILFVQGNKCRGASWAIETIGDSAIGSKQFIQGNLIEAEFCGISTTQGDGTMVADNQVFLSPMAFAGIELASMQGECTASGNMVAVEDISTVNSYGIVSSTHAASTTLNIVNNVITASVCIHVVPNEATATLNVLNNSIRFGNIGVRNVNSGHFTAKGNRMELVRATFAYGPTETIGAYPVASSVRYRITDNVLDATPGVTFLIGAATDVLIERNTVFEDNRSKYTTIEHNLAGGVSTTARVLGNTILNSNSNNFYVPLGTVIAGSRFVSRGNTRNDVPDDFVEADNAYVFGKQSTYASVSFTPGSIAAGAVATSSNFNAFGVAVGDIVEVIPPGALGALIAYGSVASVTGITATVNIRVFNPTGGAITGPAGTWGVLISKR